MKGYKCDPADGKCSAVNTYEFSDCGGDDCSAAHSSGTITPDTPPWFCHTHRPYTVPTLYKGLFRGSDVNSGAKLPNADAFNMVIKFDYAVPPTVQFRTLFRTDPPYDQAAVDTYLSVYCNNDCGNGTSKALDIVSWNTGGGVAPNWSGKEAAYLIEMLPTLVLLGYNGLTLDIEYFDTDFTTRMIEDIAKHAKSHGLHFCITVMGWGPDPAPGVASWADLDFTNIDLFVPQCYGGAGLSYSNEFVAKICKYWVDGVCPDPKGCRGGFTPCRVPPEKLAVGLGDKGAIGYVDEVAQYAKAGYVVWGSKWTPNWNGCPPGST